MSELLGIPQELFFKSVLQTVPFKLAIIDEKAHLVAATDAWKKFCLDSLGSDEACRTGTNCFELFKKAFDPPVEKRSRHL